MKPICAVPECDRRAVNSRGWCDTHYQRWRANGDPGGASFRVFSYGGKSCEIAGCDRPARKRNWCGLHYGRWERHGDPLVSGGTPQGASPGSPQRYFRDVVLNYLGDECLIWPFSKNKAGYGRIRKTIVSRLVCIEVNGQPPTGKHQAAHSCGNGTSGCVTRGHLSWKEPKANSADKDLHGTQNRGERHNRAKITEATAREILALKGVLSVGEIAAQLNVSAGIVSDVLRRVSWKWLDAPAPPEAQP